MATEVEEIRRRLDEVDDAIVDALAERQRLVVEMGKAKSRNLEAPLRDQTREQDLLTRVVARGRGRGLDGFFVGRVFRTVLDFSLRVQEAALLGGEVARRAPGLRVGFQGTEGAFSYLAATRHFGTRPGEHTYQGFTSFEEMLEAVQREDLDYAVLPIENTTAGSIDEAYDLLTRLELPIVGEEIQPVALCLLALEDVPSSRIRRVFSHPVALAQCGRFLATLRDCHAEAYADTAMAARMIREAGDASQAAIASAEAAELYGLRVLARDIADQRENYTRMAIVSKHPIQPDPRMVVKTSLVFAVRHEEGALVRCLQVLADHRLSMTKLESRPRPRNPWEYLFYVDFEGCLPREVVESAIRRMSAHASYLKVLGSYPSRTTRAAAPAEPRPQVEPAAVASPTAAPVPVPEKVARPASTAYTLASREHRSEDTLVPVGDVLIGGETPVVIAGPCAVESREQIFACARLVKELGGHLLRGGCFKPRTSPYSFQGLGWEALDLLVEAGEAVGLPIVTEVMHPGDVARAAERCHVLQVGARNMQNFSLLKEMGRVDRPILLKRGLMSSIDEWLAAAEHVLSGGNQQVILCERGIRTFETSTRTTLDLSAVPIVRELTHLPVLVDPSHAVGVRRWVPPMAEAALASGAHGVMVEIHPDPPRALSDGPQALTFDMFAALMGRLVAGAKSHVR